MAGFKYTPLQQNEIRLLRQISNGELSFEIVHSNLHVKPRYCALSYTWGAPIFSQKIVLDKQQFSITQNLQDALRRLTNRRDLKPRLISKGDLFWVDAICIDQNNTTERSQQVRLMRTLYEQAQKVYVWLGEPENTLQNELAAQKMEEFSKLQQRSTMKNRPYRPWWMPIEAPRWQDDLYQAQMDILPGSKKFFDAEGTATYNAWLGIVAIWRKPWWTRTWVLQEATMPENITTFYISGLYIKPAESKVIFLCGWSYIPWKDLQSAMIVARRLQNSPGLETGFMGNADQGCRQIARLRLQRFQGQEISFLDFLQTFRATECQDPRDKVYAPLGLCTPEVVQNVTVDYERPISEVYLNVIQFLISQPGQELNFLGYTIYSREQSLSLPSWIPNWHNGAVISPLPKVLYIAHEAHGIAIRPFDRRNGLADDLKAKKAMKRNVYNASGGTRLKAFISGDVLCISGINCDTIVDLNDDPSLDKSHEWDLRSRNQYSTKEPFETVLRRTSAADVQYNTLGRACARNGSIDYDLMHRAKAEFTLDQYEKQDTITQAYNAAMRSRKLCLTQRGYIGLVPRPATVGDKVYVFLGGQVLYTLRPDRSDESRFTYIGECYVHGLMDGEVMTWVDQGPAMIEELVLA